MLVVAVIGVLAFLIGLLARIPQGQQAGAAGASAPSQSPRWYELTLALILLAAIAAFAIWLVSSGTTWEWGDTINDWRSDTRGTVFVAIMIAIGAVGLILSLIYALLQSSRQPHVRSAIEPAPEGVAGPVAAVPTPTPLRLLGLLALALAIVLLCWIALAPADQYVLMLQLVYPAGLGVTLVLLFDKATRAWGTKGAAETFREWLFCDILAFLLVLGFLHLRGLAKPEAYGSSFWDILNVVLYFAAFWLIDRTTSRSRFLVGYGYLIVLPLLLLIWDSVQATAAAASWWGSLWPFLILAVVFFVLEVVTVVSSTTERHTLPAVKDALFVVLYAVLLIVAMRSHG